MSFKRMKRVCILTSNHNPDDNRVYYKEVLSLQRLGYHVVYIAPNASSMQHEGVECVDIPKPASVIRRLCGLWHIYRVARRQKCEICHFQDMELIVVGLMLKFFTPTKVIYDVHEDYPSQMLTKHYLKDWQRKPLNRMVKFLEKLSDKYFDAIVTADNFVYTHFSPEKTTVLYNFPDTRLMDDSMDRNAEKKWDLIFPGAMAKFTANIILEAVRIARDRGYRLRTALISQFHFSGGMAWVEERIAELGLDRGDFLLKYRIPTYEVPHYICSTKVGLIPLPDTPKMRANIPTKMFEYMYCGIPVVTGDLPPSGQFMKKDDYGILVDPSSAEEYADAIIRLIDDPGLAARLGEKGRELVLTRYNWQQEEQKLDKIYRKLLA